MTITPRTLELRMTTDHLNEALQQYFGRFGYVNEDEYYEVQEIKLEDGKQVFLKGKVVDNG